MSFINVDLPSEDEEDDDYDVAKDNTAEREDLAPGARPTKPKRGIKRGRGAPTQAADADAGDEEGDVDAADGQNEEEEADPEPINDAKTLAKRAKIDAVWQALNSRDTGGANAAGTAGAPSNNISLAALCGRAQEKGLKSDLSWQKQLGLVSPQLQYKLFGSKPSDPQQQQQQQGSQAGAAAETSQKAQEAPEANREPASVAEAAGSCEAAGMAPPAARAPKAAISEGARAAAVAALAAAKEAASLGVARSYNKVAITETRRFAGQDIQVTVQVDKGSKEAAKLGQKEQKASGLDRFLAELEKKKKVNVLDKSKMDWNQMKSKDNTMEEEMEAHKRSSNKYLDKVDFLKKAELREYELERDKRLQSDVRLRNRL